MNKIITVIVRLITPFIIIFALYLQFHGEISPGGGFQAGIILALAFILNTLTFHKDKSCYNHFNLAKFFGCVGVLAYSITGIISIFKDYNYLDYNLLATNKIVAQKIGIMLVELGVGITVYSIMLLVYYIIIYERI